MEAIEEKVDRLHGLHILRPILERTFKKDYNFNTLQCFSLILDLKIRYSGGIFAFDLTF